MHGRSSAAGAAAGEGDGGNGLRGDCSGNIAGVQPSLRAVSRFLPRQRGPGAPRPTALGGAVYDPAGDGEGDNRSGDSWPGGSAVRDEGVWLQATAGAGAIGADCERSPLEDGENGEAPRGAVAGALRLRLPTYARPLAYGWPREAGKATLTTQLRRLVAGGEGAPLSEAGVSVAICWINYAHAPPLDAVKRRRDGGVVPVPDTHSQRRW